MTDLIFLERLEQIVQTTTDRVLSKHVRHTTAEFKSDGSIVTQADVEMQAELQHALLSLSADTRLLGEEMRKDQQSAVMESGAPYWCLDPLDGTNNFHHGVPLFAVSVARIVEGEIQLGLVYDPVRRELFSALKGEGLRINGEPHQPRIQPGKLSGCLASVDFKRLDQAKKSRLLAKMPFKSQRNVGTCALEWAWVAAGRVQLLLHGGEKFWDYAAGSLLVDEAGGVSCSDDRGAIFNHTLDSRPVIAASTPELHHAWLKFLLD